jgi:hypothetical protein
LHPLPEEEHHLTVEAAAVEPSIQRFPALPNSSLVDGNGGKVQTLIADTFEGYDVGKVKVLQKIDPYSVKQWRNC